MDPLSSASVSFEAGNTPPGLRPIPGDLAAIVARVQQQPIDPSSFRPGSDVRNLMVNYIPTTVTEEELHDLFAVHGPLLDCRIIRDKVTQQPRGFGFVTYEKAESAQAAMATHNGLIVRGKRLKVAPAQGTHSQHIAEYLAARESGRPTTSTFIPRYSKMASANLTGAGGALSVSAQPWNPKPADSALSPYQPIVIQLPPAGGTAGTGMPMLPPGCTVLIPVHSGSTSFATAPPGFAGGFSASFGPVGGTGGAGTELPRFHVMHS